MTPGYLVRLGDGTTYRTDRQGKALRESAGGTDQADPAEDPRSTAPINDEHHEINKLRLSHTVEGGIGGWRTGFETDSDQLSDADEDELRRLIQEAQFFDQSAVLDVEPTTVVHDGIISRLRISIDRRSREVVRGDGYEVEDGEAFAALARWVSERTPPAAAGQHDGAALTGALRRERRPPAPAPGRSCRPTHCARTGPRRGPRPPG